MKDNKESEISARSPDSPVKNSASSLKLDDGSRVAVIGGGPAGSFFSYFLQSAS